LIYNSKLYSFFLFLIGFINFYNAQEIKFVNSYGNPIPKRKVVIYGPTKDTLITNKKGLIYLKRKTSFDSISFIKSNQNLITKSKRDLTENIFKVLLSPSNSLPVFETKTNKHSQVHSTLKEIYHESVSLSDIYSSQAASGAELLLLTDGVTIQKSQAGGGSPIIRGFEANRILLMIDGVRMNNAIYRSGHLQNSLTIDPFIIENCDVIYGSSAVSYGSDAIGGVIHYKTIKPKLSKIEDKKNISLNYFNRLNSGTEEITNHLNLNIGFKKFASFSSATYKQFGNIKMGKRRTHGYSDWGKVHYIVNHYNNKDTLIANSNPLIQKGVGYEQLDLTQKILYKPLDDLSFEFNSQLSSSSNIARFDQLNNVGSSGPQFSQWDYGPQKRWMNSLAINSTFKSPIFDKFNMVLSHQKIEESRITRKFQSFIQNINIESVDVIGASVQAVKEIGAFSRISYGTEVYKNKVKSEGTGFNINTQEKNIINSRYPDGGSELILSGFYAIFNLKKNHFSVFTGLRYSINNVIGIFEDTSVQIISPNIELENESINGSLNISYYPHQKTKITFDLSSGFKSPNVDDLGKVFTKDDFITIPNNNLTPERSYCSSMGWNQNFYLFQGDLKLHFFNAAYGTYLNNVIVKNNFKLNGTDSLFYNNNFYRIIANQNNGNALIYGLNSSFDVSLFEKFILHSSISYTKGIILQEKTPLGHVPPVTGKISLNYNNKNWKFSTFSFFNGNKRRSSFGPGNVDNPNEACAFGYPKWWTINFKIEHFINENLRIVVGGYNLHDIHYKTFASGISSPGRSFLVSFKLSY
tara:strand:- start:14089 stop:16512 length:2424 start_codon:yes stop_codon:yes gene_type:complete